MASCKIHLFYVGNASSFMVHFPLICLVYQNVSYIYFARNSPCRNFSIVRSLSSPNATLVTSTCWQDDPFALFSRQSMCFFFPSNESNESMKTFLHDVMHRLWLYWEGCFCLPRETGKQSSTGMQVVFPEFCCSAEVSEFHVWSWLKAILSNLVV